LTEFLGLKIRRWTFLEDAEKVQSRLNGGKKNGANARSKLQILRRARAPRSLRKGNTLIFSILFRELVLEKA
jgi:hypothetical protein